MRKSQTARLVERLIDRFEKEKREKETKKAPAVLQPATHKEPKIVRLRKVSTHDAATPKVPRLSGREWRQLAAEVAARDGYACMYCSSTRSLHCDHKTPISRGGSNDIENLATACLHCNLAKYNRTVEEFLATNVFIKALLKQDPKRVRILGGSR